MRIIAGEFKGRQLKAVPGNSTRPTTDKVKEAVFSMIGPFFQGGSALDLFAGSGSLGIETLSRGMDFVVFVDKNPKAVHTISENIKSLNINDDNIEIYRADAFRAIKAAAKRKLQFNLIFLDPPYKKVVYDKLLTSITEHHLLAKDGIIYCEHDPSEAVPHDNEHFSILKREQYGGSIGITIYKRKS